MEGSLGAKCLNPARRNRRFKRLAEDWTQLLGAAQDADSAQDVGALVKHGDPAAGLQGLSLRHSKQVLITLRQLRPGLVLPAWADAGVLCCSFWPG